MRNLRCYYRATIKVFLRHTDERRSLSVIRFSRNTDYKRKIKEICICHGLLYLMLKRRTDITIE